eukprot:COSAG04_NODE_7193_length_1170_cov_1.408964_1_plen_330_part_01
MAIAAWVLLVTATTLAAQADAPAPEVAPPTRLSYPVFTHGDGRVRCWRIPALIEVSPWLLAFAEARNYTTNQTLDHASECDFVQRDPYGPPEQAQQDEGIEPQLRARVAGCGGDRNCEGWIGVRRSSDGGASWGPIRLFGREQQPCAQPMAVYDRQRRRVLLQFACGLAGLSTPAAQLHAQSESDALSAPRQIRLFQVSSTDSGAAWSRAQDLSHIFPATGTPNPGPGTALQLRPGNKRAGGRLIFGGWLPWSGGKPNGLVVWVSDDGGSSFSLANTSAIARSGVGDESVFGELANGDVIAVLRNEQPWACFGCSLDSNCTTCPQACYGL